MRLGKEQAAGYVEDYDTALDTEVPVSDSERAPVAPEPEPAAMGG